MQMTPSGAPTAGALKPTTAGDGEGEGKKRPAWLIPCAIGCAVIFCLSSCAVVGIFGAIAVPNFIKARGRANMRHCFANQKVIAGAIEMYALDNDTTVTSLDSDMFDSLRTQGYLQRIPTEPGSNPETSSNYILIPMPGSSDDHPIFTPFCTNHGFIQPPGGTNYGSTPRQQAEAAGVTDNALLARCSTVPADKAR